jgi:hypothetical protein
MVTFALSAIAPLAIALSSLCPEHPPRRFWELDDRYIHTLNNRIGKPHRKMSGASTTKNNLKNNGRNPPTKTYRKIALWNHTEKWVVQAPPTTTSKTLPETHQQKHIEKSHWETTPKKMSGASTTKNNLKNIAQKPTNKNTLENRNEKQKRKMSGASTNKNNLKNIAQNPPTKTHWKIGLKNHTGKYHTEKWVVQAPPKTTSKTQPKTHQQKHIEKSHWKTTPINEWCMHYQKQRKKHCPKPNNKNRLENRIEKPHRKMNGASTIKNNF